LEEHEQQHGPLPGHEKVGSWLLKVQVVNESALPSASPPPVQYPTPPAAPPKDDFIPESDSECSNNFGQPGQRHQGAPPAYIFRDGQRMFHKMYQSRQPFTFVDTGLYQGGQHDWYGVHNERDHIWSGHITWQGLEAPQHPEQRHYCA
jgi:hypothetical protein